MSRNTLPALPEAELQALSAWHGALAAGVPALALTSLAVVSIPLLQSTAAAMALALLPAMWAEPLLEGLGLLSALVIAIPVAILARRQVARAAELDPDRGRAAAAGVGMATAMVSGGAALVYSGSLVGLAEGSAVAAALLVTGVVGGAAFRALPARVRASGVPSLYGAAAAAGLGAGTLMVLAGWMDAAALLFPVLDLPRLLLYQALPHPFNDLASIAVIMGSLAPISYLVARGTQRLMPETRASSIGAGLALTLVSPTLSMLMVALMTCVSTPAIAVNHVFMAVGALIGALPNLAALGLALRGTSAAGTSEDRAPVRLLAS